jgi:hypothetical protein
MLRGHLKTQSKSVQVSLRAVLWRSNLCWVEKIGLLEIGPLRLLKKLASNHTISFQTISNKLSHGDIKSTSSICHAFVNNRNSNIIILPHILRKVPYRTRRPCGEAASPFVPPQRRSRRCETASCYRVPQHSVAYPADPAGHPLSGKVAPSHRCPLRRYESSKPTSAKPIVEAYAKTECQRWCSSCSSKPHFH